MRSFWTWTWLPAIVLVGCSGTQGDRLDVSSSRLTVTRGDLITRVLLTGELVAEEAEQLVVPNVNIWPVQIRWLAEDGIEVAAGDRVVEFDNTQLTSNLEQLRVQVIEAANQLVGLQARAAAEEDAAAFEVEQKRAAVAKARLEADVPAGVLAEHSRQQRQLALDKAVLQLAEAETKLEAKRLGKRSEIEVQRIKLARARAEVAQSEQRLELLVLRATRDGILVLGSHPWEKRTLQVGDGVYPGWVIGRLPDLATMMVSARLFDVDDGRILPGMEVAATLDAFPETGFSGKVREIDQIANQVSPESLRRFFRVKIDLDGVDAERMRPGMSVKVLLEDARKDVLIAPRHSLDGSGEGTRARLADGTWTPVTLGACNARACEIGHVTVGPPPGGLAEGTRLGRAPRGG